MIGRLDDYLREVAHDSQAAVSESDICQAGLAVTKRAYAMYRERGYEAVLLVAALRGDYHLTELAGADLVMSIHPSYQEVFVKQDLPREERIEQQVPADVIDRLRTMPEFVRSYEPDGMRPDEFMAFGLTQRTLSQFTEVRLEADGKLPVNRNARFEVRSSAIPWKSVWWRGGASRRARRSRPAT